MLFATIDSVPTTQTLHDNLQSMGVFAATINGNIDKLHNKFDKNYSRLIVRGTTIENPIITLFDATLWSPATISSHTSATNTRTTLMTNLLPSPMRH